MVARVYGPKYSWRWIINMIIEKLLIFSGIFKYPAARVPVINSSDSYVRYTIAFVLTCTV